MRLATFNVRHGSTPGVPGVDLDRFADAVRLLDADVLALQEVDRGQPRSDGADLVALAAEALGATHHRFAAATVGVLPSHRPARPDGPDGCRTPGEPAYGIAIVSRYPVTSWARRVLPAPTRPVRLGFADGPRWVRDEPRTALGAVVATPDGPLTVVTTHLSRSPSRGARQLREVVDLADVLRDDGAAVLLGDLNMRIDRATALSGWRPLACADTTPVDDPLRQIDHVLAPHGGHGTCVQALGRAEAVATGMSDHRALVVDVAMPGSAGSAGPASSSHDARGLR